jgi:perosamine synthetase
MIESLLCNADAPLISAISKIDANGMNCVFVVDEHLRFLGLLTDGDVRRKLIEGLSLQVKVGEVCNTSAAVARDSEDYQTMLSKITPGVWILPVVNDTRVVVDYFEYRNRVHIPVSAPDLSGNEFKYLSDAFQSTWISSSGEYIKRFEQAFADYCGCKYGVAVSNGTTAISLALSAIGIKPGDEIIVPDLTFAATINTVIHAGGTPVIVDIDKDSWCIDPNKILQALTPKTKAIIPVHLYGQPCDMPHIAELAQDNGLYIVEDCAEAHGAMVQGRKVGSFGDVGCFSFFANKIITTGEGGMCVTNDAAVYEKMMIDRDHGMSKSRKYWHERVGYNFRMTNLQAAIGLAQFERIGTILAQRRNVEETYRKYLSQLDSFTFQQDALYGSSRVVWLMSLLLKSGVRDNVVAELQTHKVDVRPFFYPLSMMEIYKKYAQSTDVSHRISAQGINLPTANSISHRAIQRVCEVLFMILQKKA